MRGSSVMTDRSACSGVQPRSRICSTATCSR
jgi:hypothetical protein